MLVTFFVVCFFIEGKIENEEKRRRKERKRKTG
jgi:hypothetical protein